MYRGLVVISCIRCLRYFEGFWERSFRGLLRFFGEDKLCFIDSLVQLPSDQLCQHCQVLGVEELTSNLAFPLSHVLITYNSFLLFVFADDELSYNKLKYNRSPASRGSKTLRCNKAFERYTRISRPLGSVKYPFPTSTFMGITLEVHEVFIHAEREVSGRNKMG